MKQRLYDLILDCWKFGQFIVGRNHKSIGDWDIIGKERQRICSEYEKQGNFANYQFVRTVTLAIEDFFVAASGEERV